MTLQAWFDDSGTKGTGRYMSMAGLFGEAEQLASVADDWDKHLRATYPGAIRYFKMDEACSLDGEFRHWKPENRDAKVKQMAGVIDRDDIMVVAILIDLEAFQRISGFWQGVRGRHTLSQPYLQLFQVALVTSVTEAVERKATKPMEIVFDDHPVFRPEIIAGYNELRDVERSHPERLAVMPVQPWFRDDMEFVVLQAADLLAGEVRLFAERDEEDLPSFLGGLCPKLRGRLQIIAEDEMRDIHQYVQAAIARVNQDVA